MWSTGEGNGNPLQYSCLENPMKIMKTQKDRTLIIRQMQIKNAIRYHLTLVRMTIIKKNLQTINAVEGVEKREPNRTVRRSIETITMENTTEIPHKTKTKTTISSVHSLSRV